ncbi:hypothetical protein DKM44_06480 [Deinococcus irradiatisoli]|uniref:Uncharacterized protein n=1 Tax=Deinococcus irradiatisoli TaxID=2202254 RepID=A0A2Z3JG11_9DEIO|nr:hypothetical protein [Deinococcus irradiatisoli]AWN22916.1 hypothetical protein DKM44_06480 [Deinococcus irradiatisoli]
MQKPAFTLAALLTLSAAQALTLQGSVTASANLGPHARVGVWSLGPAGAAGNELASAPLVNGTFSLPLPDGAPPTRAQFPLRPETIGWPGVVGDVTLSAAVQGSELGLFVYDDSNGNGRRDDHEPLLDAFPDVQRQPLITVWVSGNVSVKAGHGFSVNLNSGWNSFLIDLGRSAAVSFYQGQPVNLRVPR